VAYDYRLEKPMQRLVGKTISHVIIKTGISPQSQLFLVFTDGSYYEFFGGMISGATGLDVGGIEEVRRYMSPPQEIVVDV